jgi:hypothetical protein
LGIKVRYHKKILVSIHGVCGYNDISNYSFSNYYNGNSYRIYRICFNPQQNCYIPQPIKLDGTFVKKARAWWWRTPYHLSVEFPDPDKYQYPVNNKRKYLHWAKYYYQAYNPKYSHIFDNLNEARDFIIINEMQ